MNWHTTITVDFMEHAGVRYYRVVDRYNGTLGEFVLDEDEATLYANIAALFHTLATA